ncbi:hypothetical protein THASP1DRAFT_30250 [Thamnocephalis sphaerospora]|uniref:polynucleotide adenylyltransferase n=1 Tax=Thamnocephalis sphaerospora TaxID=78915 RepID=A0A4P9XPK0_9FUNG|nr:hypothetical protein THASP1DRAFT_30250 [Thamnocephalis sphaerospora]|eukprot:RKP07933.1 hypothetical protein THASP1DRAFT_30250 [Thamnocephalis sphaerospora]
MPSSVLLLDPDTAEESAASLLNATRVALDTDYYPFPTQARKRKVKQIRLSGQLLHDFCDQIDHLYNSLRLTKEDMQTRQDVVSRIQRLLNQADEEEVSSVQLSSFGSSRNGLAARTGDLDIGILFLGVADPAATTYTENTRGWAMSKLKRVAQIIEKENHVYSNVTRIFSASAPLVRFRDEITGIDCDITLDQQVAHRKTLLLGKYADSDPRVRPLIFAVKEWARVRKINSASPKDRTLNSYTHTLMLLAFLQQRGVVPCLQRICCDKMLSLGKRSAMKQHTRRICITCKQPLPSLRVGTCETYFYEGKPPKSDNLESVGELLLEFFRYYAITFDVANVYVSVGQGYYPPLPYKIKTRQRGNGVLGFPSDRQLHVEDLFRPERNCAKSAKPYVWRALRWEYERALVSATEKTMDGLLSDSFAMHVAE